MGNSGYLLYICKLLILTGSLHYVRVITDYDRTDGMGELWITG